MKKNYLFIVSLIAFKGFSQIVNIPDPNFKAWLLHYGNTAVNTNGDNFSTNTDSNNDGEIQVSEAALVTGLSFSSSPITEDGNISSLEGIQYFTNLKRLSCSGNSIGALDVSMLPSLEYLNCAYNQMSSINVAGLSQLKEVQCHSNNLYTLDLTGLESLEVLWAQENHLSSLSFGSTPSIRNLWLSYNDLEMMDLTMLQELESLVCFNNALSQLDIAGLENLEGVDASYNSLTSIDLSGLYQLNDISISNNFIPSVDLSDVTALNYLDLADNPLTAIDLSGLSNLEYLRINNTLINSLDCSQTAVVQLSCKDSPNLTSINVRNNVYSINDENMLWFTLFFGNLPALQSVCVDDGEQDSIIPGNFYNAFGNVAVHTGDNCNTEIQMGIAENTPGKFIIYPNPASDMIHIQSADNLEGFSLKIYTVTGMVVQTYANVKSGTPINTSGLASGTYFLKIENEANSGVKKLVKM